MITTDQNNSVVEAVAVKGNRIVLGKTSKSSKKYIQKRRAVLLTAIHNILGEPVNVIGAEAGLHLLVEPNNHMSEDELIEVAKKVGVKVYPLSIYYENPPTTQKSMVLLGFAGLDENEIIKGITLLQRAWFE